ncbi:substrate-binding periplasmic protein [Bdellovibrio bacteriovorus]|uniref:substrate-binding periplasmic protein n=1 Tax=Bdellovibrio bacteriovorus TaxID=959 RepID=UPI0035A6A050
MNALMALALILTPLCSLAKSSEPKVIRYGINSNYAMPLINVERVQNTPKLEGGLLKDLGLALFKELNLDPTWILLPKSRVASNLNSGNVHLVCHLNEVWQPAIRDTVSWSHELYRSSNLIVYIGGKPIHKAKDLYGKRVGGVLNFIYQYMDDYFKKGLILREDGPNNESNIQKLLNGRIDYIIMSNLEFEYYKKIYSSLESADLGMDEVITKCALSPKAPVSLEELNRAIDTIRKNGTLEKILKSYN